MASRQQERRAIRYGSAKRAAEEHEKDFTPTSLAIPTGFKMFKPKKPGLYRLRILPYTLDDLRGNPRAMDEDGNPLRRGDCWFERTYYNHPSVGIDEGVYCCPKRNFGQPCRICKDSASEPDEKAAKSLRARERQLFNVLDMDDFKTGPQIWEFSYHNFGKQLDAKVAAKPRYDTFWHLTDGFVIEVTLSEESMGTYRFLKASNIEMEPDKDLDEDYLDKVADLDQIPIQVDSDELERIYLGEVDDRRNGRVRDEEPRGRSHSGSRNTERDDDRPSRRDEGDDRPRGKSRDEDLGPTATDLGIEEGMEVEHEKWGLCKVTHVSGDGTSLRLKDSEGEVHNTIAPADVEIPDPKPRSVRGRDARDDNDDDRPRRSTRDDDRPRSQSHPKEDEDDKPRDRRSAKDDDDAPLKDDDDDKPRGRAKKEAPPKEDEDKPRARKSTKDDDDDDRPRGRRSTRG